MGQERAWFGSEMSKELAENFKQYLRGNNIKFEPSECYDLVHFECFMTEEEAAAANTWLLEDC